MNSSRSRATAGEGVDSPSEVFICDLSDETGEDPESDGVILWWDGNGYDKQTCWFIADDESVVSLSDSI